ncbi:hypothetical protein SAMN02745121_06458 [Nannocystis exedens]|uniref:Uncharacterized protein n=2 Tax=Nannocystis exedens TaxID=54 RepID=A0A1I2F5T5_9BACT|nr:hypothetical protein NAEX_06166 [Nannocystis exedens]SFF00535.1 hypothetical protein SAMN02745121_06458 [Nannocystis exedens]
MLDSAHPPLYTDLVRFFLGAAARAELGVDAMQPLSDAEMLRPYLYLYRRSIFGQLMAPLHRARREARQAKTDGELAGLHEALLAILDARSIA